MADARIVFNSEGFRQILLSEGTQKLVQETADTIRDQANANYDGDGFVSNTIIGGYGGGRWIGFVKATDKESMIAESEDLALTRAIT